MEPNQEKLAIKLLQERHGSLLEVDIHGMTAEEARRGLEQLLNRADATVTEIRVIHGYNGGQTLRDMVRLRLKHPRIAAKLVCLNPGETRILLKKGNNRVK